MNYIMRLLYGDPFTLRVESTTSGTEISIYPYNSSRPISYDLVLGMTGFSDAIYWLLINRYIEPTTLIETRVEMMSPNKLDLIEIKNRLISNLLSTNLTQIP